ncbi:MAG: hypothetical protein ABI721_00300 [Candidatus Dojkabacteria bacterium]
MEELLGTINIDSLEGENFNQEIFSILEKYNSLINTLQTEGLESIEIIGHEMATVTLYKNLFRVQLEKLLQTLLIKEIDKLSNVNERQLLSSITLENISIFLENDLFLDGSSISNTLKNIVVNIMNKVNIISENWTFLLNTDTSVSPILNNINKEVEYLFADNVNTFLGENLILREDLFKDKLKNFGVDDQIKLMDLIKVNGARKIEFGYDMDFGMIKYLIDSAIRCKNQLHNEREDIELFNLITILITFFRNNLGTQKILDEVINIYEDRPEVIAHLKYLMNLELLPKLIIENSPPIYKKVQKNLMFRIYEHTDGGVKVHIHSIPYSQIDAEKSIDDFIINNGLEIQSFPNSVNRQTENKILSRLVATNLSFEEAVKMHTSISKIGLQTIKNNDSLLDPILEKLNHSLKPFVKEVAQILPQLINDQRLRAQYVDQYESRIKGIHFHHAPKSSIETDLSEAELTDLQEKIMKRVMEGQSFEAAIGDIVDREDFNLRVGSQGDCVQFETKIEQVAVVAQKSEDLSGYKDGTVLTSKKVEGNGFQSTIREKVIDGKKINTVTCLVCQKEFDTCNDKCPECDTSREMQYNAIYNGNTRLGKEAIKTIQERIDQKRSEVESQLNDNVVKETNQSMDPWLGKKVEGVFSQLISVVTFGAVKESPKYYEN